MAWGAAEDEGALGGSGGELCHGLMTSWALHDCWMCQWVGKRAVSGIHYSGLNVQNEAVSRLQVEMVALSFEEDSRGKLFLCIFLKKKLVYYGLVMRISCFLEHSQT